MWKDTQVQKYGVGSTHKERNFMMESFITITEKASNQIQHLLQELPDDVGVRFSIKGGGCAGFTYDMQMDSIIEEDDTMFLNDGYKVMVDNKSLLYMDGISLDFVTEGLNTTFQFSNPNATSSCGCGESFGV